MYEGVLARDLEFKLLKAAWTDDEQIELKTSHVAWETLATNHKVGEGGIPYRGSFNHTIRTEFR